jgi:4-carboxymuconolactone decarboxylase
MKRRDLVLKMTAASAVSSCIASPAAASAQPLNERSANSAPQKNAATEYAARGKTVVAEMLGQPFEEKLSAVAASNRFGAANAELALEFAFGAVWARDGLSRKQRSLVTIGILIGSGRFNELKNHVRAGVRNGLDVGELQEVLVQAVPYCGFPAAAEATESVVAVLKDLGLLDGSNLSSRERGLL